MATVIEKSSNIEIVLKGNIKGIEVFDLLRDISLPKYSGVLKIKISSKKEYRLYFKEGAIVYAENSMQRMDSRILSMIKNSGLISRDTIVAGEKKKSKIMKRLLEILIEEGHVSMLLYSKIISAAVRITILDAMLLKKGAYEFEKRPSSRDVHGVKPVDIKGLQQIASMSEKKTKVLKMILKSLYCDILTNKGAAYFSLKKSFLQNFLVTEIDFIKYVSHAADNYLEGGWTIQSRFQTAKVVNTVFIYSFRTFVFILIFAFLYIATMTTVFETRKEHRSVRDFYFFKVSLISSLLSFEEGGKVDRTRLLKSGMITEKEIELSGLKNNEDK